MRYLGEIREREAMLDWVFAPVEEKYTLLTRHVPLAPLTPLAPPCPLTQHPHTHRPPAPLLPSSPTYCS